MRYGRPALGAHFFDPSQQYYSESDSIAARSASTSVLPISNGTSFDRTIRPPQVPKFEDDMMGGPFASILQSPGPGGPDGFDHLTNTLHSLSLGGAMP